MQNHKKEITQEQPFKVFYTEEEWREAIAQEIRRFHEISQRQSKANDNVAAMKQKLLEEEAKIKERFPEFNLREMLINDPEFKERIMKGYSVEEAFYLSNRKKAEEPAPRKHIGMRENGRSNYMGAGANRNIANMSDAEFKKYINSIKGSKF